MNKLLFDTHIDAYVYDTYSYSGPDKYKVDMEADFTVARVTFSEVAVLSMNLSDAKKLQKAVTSFIARYEKREASAQVRADIRTTKAREQWEANKNA